MGSARVGTRRVVAIRSLLAIVVAAAAVALAGCAPTVAMDPAAGAGSPACAAVTVRLPDDIGGFAARDTDAQATGAWGYPTVITLHCGVDSPAPTSDLPCVSGDTVDWLVDDSDSPNYKLTAYGRNPSVTVAFDYSQVSGNDVIAALDQAVSQLPQVGKCIGVDDLPATATPAPAG